MIVWFVLPHFLIAEMYVVSLYNHWLWREKICDHVDYLHYDARPGC